MTVRETLMALDDVKAAITNAYSNGYEAGKKPWVGLTDDEMMQIYVELKTGVGYYSEEKYARAIEAKLKEKNT